jgi:CRP-like cAMP-binding protein
LLRPEPPWTPVFWALVFVGINLFRAWQIFRERRPASLTPDEESLYNQAFSSLSSHQFGKLSAAGLWRDLDVGEMLQTIGDPVTRVTALASGKMDVSRNGKPLGSFGPGDLLGITCLFEDSPEMFRELLDTRVAEPARVLEWDANELKQLAQADPVFDHVFSKLVASSLATKLIRFVELK